MENGTEKRPTVKTLEDLAALLGVHRRTLGEYVKAGCPAIKAKAGGYLVAPTVAWFGRMLMRRQIAKFLKHDLINETLTESINQVLVDHEKAWPVWLQQEHKP
ncbi:MAG: hypothetical protein ACK526_13990 [Planctomyces sp.]